MSSRRSYLETLNQGRQRRPHTSLDELNRTLERLEGQLQASQHRREARPPEPRAQHHAPEPVGRPKQPTHHLSREAPRPASASFGALAREMERNRAQGDEVAAAGKIASELQGLRDELRQQMTSSLRREFETLRSEITKTYAESGHGDRELAAELERLSDAIQTLAERGEDRGVNLLRLEIEELKAAIDTLAREDTLKSVDTRWDSLGRRWDEIEERLARPAEPVRDLAVDALAKRLEEIGEAVARLPESLSVRSLEDKMRALAGAVEHLSRRSEAHPQALDAVAERLDEISRAIVASSMDSKPAVDPEALDRVEARIASLGRQIDELTGDGPFAEIAARLSRLSGRMDDIAARAEVPAETVEALTRQVAGMAERIEASLSSTGSEALWQEAERRFAALTDRIERRQDDVLAETRQFFAEAERRFGSDLSEAIDARLSDLSARIEASRPAPRDDEAMARMEERLADIAERIERSGSQASGIDPEIVRSLEAQVASLGRHLERPGFDLPELDDIAPRLERIEQSIATNRESLLSAAREAAEAAVRSIDVNSDGTGLAALAGDLKSLEALARRSDERNGKTFEAIHDTLLKIVDRLAAMEEQRLAAAEMSRAVLPVDGTPPLSAEEEAALFPETDAAPAEPRPARRSPSEAAAAAALAAVTAEDKGVASAPESGKRSLLGNLGRAISGRKEKAEKPLAGDRLEPAEPAEPDLDAPLDPKIANRPLAPGSGAPDINAIIKRVRDERGIASGKESDAARSDFIAAARRAAQAAAAEAEIMKRGGEKKKASKGFSLGGLLRSKRKSVLMATTAVLVGLGGMQLYDAYLGEEPAAPPRQEAAAAKQDAAPASPAAETTPKDEGLVAKDKAAIAAPAPVKAAAVPAGGVETAPAPKSGAKAALTKATAADARPLAPAAAEKDPAPAPKPEAATATPSAEAASPKPMPAAAAPAAERHEPAPVEAGPAALRAAADKGEPAALFEIGDRYAEGRGVEKDMAKAAAWYERAAELGLAPAQFRIGNMYEKGIGVERDIAKAKTWYQLAAAQGNAGAMHNLAVLFAMGADGTTDNESAARWFLEAAELGVKDSQFNLGILSAKGVGMPQDLAESYKWFALVAKSGDKDAAAKRDEIAGTLSPEQLEKARATAELWKARPIDPKANSVEIEEEWIEAEDRTASIDMQQAVRNVQAILAKNGYDAGAIDGIMGEKTKTAIAAFQRDNNMDATGEIDPVLIKALLAKK